MSELQHCQSPKSCLNPSLAPLAHQNYLYHVTFVIFPCIPVFFCPCCIPRWRTHLAESDGQRTEAQFGLGPGAPGSEGSEGMVRVGIRSGMGFLECHPRAHGLVSLWEFGRLWMVQSEMHKAEIMFLCFRAFSHFHHFHPCQFPPKTPTALSQTYPRPTVSEIKYELPCGL